MSYRELPVMVDDAMADAALVELYSGAGRPALPRRGSEARARLVADVRCLLQAASQEMERRALARAAARISPIIDKK